MANGRVALCNAHPANVDVLEAAMKPTEPAKRTEDGREILHFLHIGKAAGSQIGQIAREFNAQNRAFTILGSGCIDFARTA